MKHGEQMAVAVTGRCWSWSIVRELVTDLVPDVADEWEEFA